MTDDAETSSNIAGLELVTQAEAQLAQLGETFDAPGLAALRVLAAARADLGADGAGRVADSLLQLVDRLVAGGCSDREALAVHVRAWRLMLVAPPTPDSEATLLEGLARVRGIYAEAKAA